MEKQDTTKTCNKRYEPSRHYGHKESESTKVDFGDQFRSETSS